MCVVITAGTPARIAARNGTRSQASRSARPRATRGAATWLSLPVEPWPGKCFAQVRMPAAAAPRTNAATTRATCSGSAPKLRSPTGQSGTESTSATGARFQLTPIASSSRLVASATRSTRSGSPTRAIAPIAGKTVTPSVMRTTRPCSWSMAISSGSAWSAARAASCRRLVSSSTWLASTQFLR